MSIEEEIDALRRQLGSANDSELAAVLGMQRSTIAQWKKRGRIPDKAWLWAQELAHEMNENAKAREQFDRVPPGLQHISRAISLKYFVQTSEEHDMTPDGLIARIKYRDEIDRAAYILLRDTMREKKIDAIKAFLLICDSPNFEIDLTTKLMPARMRDDLNIDP